MAVLFFPPEVGLLDKGPHAIEEAGGRTAVEYAVVEGQAQRHKRARHDLALKYGWFFDDAAEAKDRGLWQVDNRGEGVDAVHAEIADGKSAALQGVGAERMAPGLKDEGARFGGDLR